MSILQLETVFYNVMAHVRSCSVYRLTEKYNLRRYYLSQDPSCCGCGYDPNAPTVPQAPLGDFGYGAAFDHDVDDDDSW